MHRATIALLAVTMLSLAAPAPRRAVAGPPPLAGTASCALQGRIEFRPYLPLVPNASGRPVRIKGKLPAVTCDGTGVTGGRAPLAHAAVALRGVMPEGTNCARFLDSVGIAKSVVSVRWTGSAPGHTVPLGTSKATVASASFDSGAGAFVIVTTPIAKGAFVGSTLSLALPLGDIAEYTRVCNLELPSAGGFSSFNWGPPQNDAVVNLTVQ